MKISELLKPPFVSRGIGEIRDSSERILFDVYENAFTLKDGPFMGLMVKLADWTVEAMNEKWKRDNPSLRWRLETDGGKAEYFLCPECEYMLPEDYMVPSRYCPACGERLLPPEGEKE